MNGFISLLNQALGIIATAGIAVTSSGCSPDTTTTSDQKEAAAPVAEEVVLPPAGDLREIISNGIAAGMSEIIIPPGQYRVTPTNREHLRLEGLENITIIADGVEMICTQTTRAITIENCENLTIRGLTIDYDPLPYTQARIISISEDASQLDVEVIEGYPAPDHNVGSVEIFNPETNQLRGRITHFSTTCAPTGPIHATLTKSRVHPEYTTEQIGDIAIIKSSHAPDGEIPHAIYATNSTNLKLENITLYSGNMFGFLENDCNGSEYIACRVDRRTPESDLVKRAYPRLRSLNADAFHSKNAQQGPLYDRCVAYFMGDDAIAINGDFHFVMESEGPNLRVLAKHKMTMREGDEIQIFAYDGTRLENRKIVSIEPDGGRTDVDDAFLDGQNMNDQLRKTALTDAYRIVLDTAIDVPPGTLICSADHIGNGFAIRNCELGFNRSRGILVKAGRGEISGNKITGSVMTSILVSPEFWWLEAGLADDLVISENVISEGRGMGIVVLATGGDGSLAPTGAFRNITVRDNQVAGGAAPGMLLASIEGLTDENNTVEVDGAKSLHPWEIGSWGREGILPVMHTNSLESSQP